MTTREWIVPMTAILGVSAFYHDSAAALVRDGEIVAAAQEERFSREKYDPRFPEKSIDFCLSEAGIGPEQIDFVAFYEQPLTKFERLMETYVAYAPAGFASFRQALPLWLRQKLHLPREIRRGLGWRYKGPILFPDHHESHAASAFFPSPFDEAAILAMDGVGEWSTTTIGHGRGNRVEMREQIRFPHSLGLLYSAFTSYCGFKVNSGEYKLMGLAPYGEPRYVDLILGNLIDVRPSGGYHMDQSWFNYGPGLTMTTEKFHRLFGGPPRVPESRLDQRHMDLAASIQKVCEEVVLRSVRHAWELTGKPKNLVMAGGVALNCVANGRLLREGPFENLWIQPASGDAGGALGAALFAWHQLLDKPRETHGRDTQKASYLGPSFSNARVRESLDAARAHYRVIDDEGELVRHVAECLAEGKIVGWCHGRAEYGPRALGARSILADPRNPATQSDLNLKIKFRESFRPFAPCVLREHVHEWFAMRPGEDSPYMLLIAPVQDARLVSPAAEDGERPGEDPDLTRRVNQVRSTIPAVTHVDNSARVQTIDERHGRFHRLLKAFHERTGCPIVVNTSFNLSWEPIVLTPSEAYHTFMQSAMDVLVFEDCVLHKAEQPLGLRLRAAPGEPRRAHPDSPWADPLSGDPLEADVACLHNPATRKCYPIDGGIPRLFVPTSGAVTEGGDGAEAPGPFHGRTSLPNYDDVENRRALIDKARSGMFARLLNDQIPYGARVVEVGCGTGQLTNFLSIANRTVLGVDACLDSLRLAQNFKEKNGLDRAGFAQMNLFRPGLRDGFFDVVISNGVLHHTGDCREAFRRIGRLARPGGHVIVSLYSAYGRKLHDARVALSRLTGLTGRRLDPQPDEGRREAWPRDPSRHPSETRHTLDEVLGWMDEDGLDFVNSIPKPTVGPVMLPGERLLEPRPRGNALGRMVSQLADMGSGFREGGSFFIIGRRR